MHKPQKIKICILNEDREINTFATKIQSFWEFRFDNEIKRQNLSFMTEVGTNFQDIKKYPRTIKR